MKRVRINVGKVGVVTRKGDYKRVLTAGTWWMGLKEKVVRYDMSGIYTSNSDLDIMIMDENFRKHIEIIDVYDNEILFKYKHNNFMSVLTPGRYFYWKGLIDFKFIKANLDKVEITEDIANSVLNRHEVAQYLQKFTVETYEEGLLLVDGKFIKKLTKGTYNFWRGTNKVDVLKADLRQVQLEVSGQEILTRDKVALRVNFYIQYKITDSENALLNCKDFEKQLYILVQLALREFIGTKTLDEILENKEAVTGFVHRELNSKSGKLGITVLDSGIRDVILPGDIKEIMNHVLVAQKKAQANIITRREETASTRSLLNTAKLMEDNNMLFKLKEMEYVEKIAEKIGEITVTGNGQVFDQLKGILTGK